MQEIIELVDSLVDELLTQEDVVPTQAAQELNRRMHNHPDEHRAFLEAMSYQVYLQTVHRAYRERRRQARSAALTFGQAASAGEVSIFTTWRCRIDEGGTQRQLGKMTATDNLYVADTYERDSRVTAMLAAFHRALAKKQGDDLVEEVLTPEVVAEMYRSITGQDVQLALVA